MNSEHQKKNRSDLSWWEIAAAGAMVLYGVYQVFSGESQNGEADNKTLKENNNSSKPTCQCLKHDKA